MPYHDWNCRSLFFSKRQEMGGEIATGIAIEYDQVRDPKAVKDREQKQRIFGGLSEGFGLFDSRRACSTAALVSGAAYPLIWMSGVMSAT
jgi:hypothetical protein